MTYQQDRNEENQYCAHNLQISLDGSLILTFSQMKERHCSDDSIVRKPIP